jgi:hypothetical protein
MGRELLSLRDDEASALFLAAGAAPPERGDAGAGAASLAGGADVALEPSSVGAAAAGDSAGNALGSLGAFGAGASSVLRASGAAARPHAPARSPIARIDQVFSVLMTTFLQGC